MNRFIKSLKSNQTKMYMLLKYHNIIIYILLALYLIIFSYTYLPLLSPIICNQENNK